MSEATSDTPTVDATVSGSDRDERGLFGTDGAVSVRVANRLLVGPLLRRMVSIVLARADWPLDGLDDALLVCDALSAHAPGHARAGWVALSVEADEREAELRVSELRRAGATDLLRDATLPVVGNVLEAIATKVLVETDVDGGSLVLVLKPNRPA